MKIQEMFRNSITCIIIAFCLAAFGCFPDSDKELEKQIGQMLLIGFRGFEVTEQSPVVGDINAGRIGGVILFDRDVALNSNERNIRSPEQVRDLIASLQNYADTPLFIAVDQEGGRVARLKPDYGFPETVSQQYLGEIDDVEITRFYAEQTALALFDAGFNVNFAPVVDLNVNPDNPVIGKIERSFSADPETVSKHSLVVIDSHHDYKIGCALKHFPGHGSSKGDSHQGFTDVTDTWSETELEPFENIIALGKADFVMTAHIFNEHLDRQYPATLSKNVMTGILRESLGFEGVIVSDDMNMKAITDHFGLEEAIFLSIDAGVDVLIFANNLTYDEDIAVKALDIILNLVHEGKISRQRIGESYSRIMDMKKRLM